MKNWVLIPLAAIVGVVAGSWGPREDLAAYKERSQEAKSAKKASDASGFGAFAKMVNIPDVARKPHHRKADKPKVAKPVGKPAATNASDEAVAEVPQKERKPHFQRLSPEDLRARIDEASELWRTRVELAKTQWKARLGISGEKDSAAFDAAFTKMNETLYDTMVAMAEEVEKAGKMTPELGLRLMGDASTAMAGAYDALGSAVPADKRNEVSELPVFEFIDPAVAEPLIGVQDKLDASFRELRK